ncbi:unnamed protein product, partial [Rotaria sp. Silwood2]
FGLQIHFYPYVAYNELCRFRSFIMNVTQVSSAWILVIVSIDRWIRTRFPFKSGSICTPKKALIAIFTTCLAPACIMLIILIDIFINVRVRKRTIIQPFQFTHGDRNMKRQKSLQKQMFILMFGSVCIFLITSLPSGIYKIQSPRQGTETITVLQLVCIGTSLQWFQSLFYATSFYIHCLSSTLFRKEFTEQVRRIWNKRQSRVSVMQFRTELQHIQPRETPMKY